MKLTAVIVAGLLTFAVAQQSEPTKEFCDDCGYVRTCFTSESSCSFYNVFINAFTDSYTSCNPGLKCGPCFPTCPIQDQDDYVPPTFEKDGCDNAGICFTKPGCASYNYNVSNSDEELRWTDEYENCNGVKNCAPFYPECVIPGIDYTPPYQKLSCTSELEFRSDAMDAEGLSCRDFGIMFEIDALDCGDAEQKADVRARQLGCCGGANYTKLFCTEYLLANLNDENNDNATLLIGGIAGGVGGVLLLVTLVIVYVKCFKSNKEYDTSAAMQKSPTKNISFHKDDEESVVSNL